MNRWIPLLLAAVMLVGVAGLAAATPVETAGTQDDTETVGASADIDETNESSISPGERLAGSISVQNAEVTGEIESRAFGVALDRAETDEERADIVAERLDRSEDRLAAIEQRQQELEERRDAGELSHGAYAARMAETAARTESVRGDLNRSAAVVNEIPESVRAERGLDAERLDTLRERANELGGPEVAAIARSVAGDDVGGPIASDRRGSPGDVPTNETDRPGTDGPPGDAAVGNGDIQENETDTAGESQSNGPPESTGSDGDDETDGTGTADPNDANGGDDVRDSESETGSANDSERDRDDVSDSVNDSDRGGDSANDTDRRGYDRPVTALGDVASDRATTGWFTLTDSVSAIDERVQRGVSDLRSRVAGSVT